jgi:hypothetical protein
MRVSHAKVAGLVHNQTRNGNTIIKDTILILIYKLKNNTLNMVFNSLSNLANTKRMRPRGPKLYSAKGA